MDAVFSKWGVRAFRGLVGLAGLAVSLGLEIRGTQPALVSAVLTFACVVLAHLGIDFAWDRITGNAAGANPGDASSGKIFTLNLTPSNALPSPTPPVPISSGSDKSPSDATVQLVIALITTAGVVLGVVQAFAGTALSLTAKIGTLALAGDVVVGFMLFGLVADSTPLQSDQAWHFRGYVFNITLWGIAFGLLCIAYSFIYR
jgi:hypothetical protein